MNTDHQIASTKIETGEFLSEFHKELEKLQFILLKEFTEKGIIKFPNESGS